MASTYLTRTPSSAGNRKTFTWSAWVKRCSVDSTHYMVTQGADSNNNWTILFDGANRLQTWNYVGGFQYNLKLTRVFRDTNAWYHIVVAVDTTQATASDRVKIYVNGVQQTTFVSGEDTYPSQNADMYVNSTNGTFRIGYYTSGGSYFNGYMSHVHFCDGSALAPTVFGSTDSTTGEWKINTSPSFTPGTNGFTILKDGNTITDQSANSNNFTVGAGTLTKSQDNPSNVFNTLNPLYRSNVSGQNNIGFNHANTTWFPSSASNTHSWGRSTLGWTSGKYYMEFKIEEAGGGQASGVWMVPTELPNDTSPQSTSNTAYGWQVQFSGSDQNFYTTNGGSTVATITTSVGSNPIVMMAIDADNNKMWIGHNGTWYNNNNASTTLNTSYPDHTWTPGTYGDMYQLAFQAYYSSGAYNNAYGNFGNGYFGTTAVASAGTNASGIGIFEYDVPTGFTALSTKGLNE